MLDYTLVNEMQGKAGKGNIEQDCQGGQKRWENQWLGLKRSEIEEKLRCKGKHGKYGLKCILASSQNINFKSTFEDKHWDYSTENLQVYPVMTSKILQAWNSQNFQYICHDNFNYK